MEETVEAHGLLMEAFESFRELIPSGQLTEVAFEDLRDAPVATVERIYTDLAIDSWARPCRKLRSRRCRAERRELKTLPKSSAAPQTLPETP